MMGGIRRAEELDRDEANPESRLVAYYCRQHAVSTGIPLATSPVGKTCLGEILGMLEKEKETMSGFTKDEAKFLCRQFSDKIFDKADLEDRTGEATKDTARTFYAAASFLEILDQFYSDDEENEDLKEAKKRAVYSKWKATEILKAIKEGRTPTPGGYGEDQEKGDGEEEEGEGNDEEKEEPTEEPSPTEETEDEEPPKENAPTPEPEEEDQDDDEEDIGIHIGSGSSDDGKEDEEDNQGEDLPLPPPPSYPADLDPTPPPIKPPSLPSRPPMSFQPLSVPPPLPAPPTFKPKPEPESPRPPNPTVNFGKGKKKKVSKNDISDATELTRFALSALEEKDVELAVERLAQALKTLCE